MYNNLNRAISENGMSWRSVADTINMPESTFRNKISNGSFSIEEAFLIKRRALPKYDIGYLFDRTDSIATPAI